MASIRRTLHKTRLPESDENDPDGISDAAHLPPPRSPLLSIPDPSQSPRKGLPGELDVPKVDYDQVWTKGGAGGTPRSAQSTPTRSISRMHFGNGATGGGNGGRLPPFACGRERGSSSRAARAIADGKSCQPTDIRGFELDQDPSFWNEHNVQVLIRIRPISSAEKAIQGHGICLRQESSQSLTWTGHPEARFTFDHIACETISQENLFKAVGVPMVENCMSGYNSCLFAYGQTGSGKTYTMMGEIRDLDSISCGDRGMTPRIFEYLFTRIREEEENRKHEKLKYSCKCSYLEIYNEQITDLLEPSSTNLQLREDVKKGVYVENLKEHNVNTVKDVIELLLQGTSNRKIAATSMNSESSRSHSVFTCSIESHWERDSMTHLRFGRLNLVDLAGSERQKSSGAEGERLKEAANINKSLSTLGLVIMTLVDIANGKHRHVPYRDSRLTFLLQDSLGGNSKTTIIANVSPSICSANETLSTLKFAQRAKLIKNNAKVNEDASGDTMALQREIQRLRDQLNVVAKQQNAPRLEPPSIYENAKVGDIIDNSGTLEGGSTCSLEKLSFFDCEMKFLKSALASSLRRENVAEVRIRTLEAEKEHMKQLVQQMEADVSRMETMLHIRDETIRKLELVSDGLLCGDKYLSEKNYALSKEIQLLREKVNQNPEQILLSLENIRLHEELRVCQDFYQRERDTLVNEISQLRNQLVNISEGEQAEANMPFRTDNQGQTDCSNLSAGSVDVSHDFTREAEDLCFQKKVQLPFCLSPSKEVVLPSKNQTAFEAGLSAVELPLIDNISGSMIALVARQQESGDIAECEDPRTVPLLVKMRKVKKELERSMKLNVQLENEKHTQLSKFADTEQIHDQVEVETARTILNLQQELVVLQQQACSRQVDDFSDEGSSSPVLLKLENKELRGRLHQITKTNVELLDCVAAKDAQIHLIANAWEKAVIDLTSFLLDGCQSLEDASSEIHSIIGSFPQCKTWISDHVERAIKTFIEKERLIVSLQKSLEDAQKLCHEMTYKLDCLKGATIAITEVEQVKYDETSHELLCLRALLNENMCTIQELEDTLKLKDNQIIDAEKQANAAFIAMKTLNEMACKIPYHARMDGQVTNGNKRFQEPILMSGSTEEMSQILHALERRIENSADSFRSLESLQLKLNDSGKTANEKAKLAANLFVKFEEAQETMKEADLILNELLKANESARLNTQKWKHENQILQMDNASLTAEVEQMRTEVAIHERHNQILINEIDAAIIEMSKLMAELEEFFQFVQNHTESEFKTVHAGISVVAMEVCEFIRFSKATFEAIFSGILQKNSPSRAMRWRFQTGKTLRSSQEVLDGKESKDGCYVVCEFPSLAGAEEALKMFQESLVKSISCSGSMKGELSDAVSATKETSFQGIMLKEETLDLIKMSDISLNCLPEQGHCDIYFRGSLSGDLKHTIVMDKSTEEMRATTGALVKVQQELAVSITQVDELLQHQKELDAQLVNSEFLLSRSRLELKETRDVLDMLVKENDQLTLLLDNVSRKKMDMEELLNDQEKVIESLEREIICLNTSVDDRIFSSTQEMMDKFKLVSKERDQLQEEVVHLNEKFEMASALADENEAIAIEAHQDAEASKVYAEEKEEEVKVLENSVEELECTINVLEEKVIDMGKEVESCRQIRENLEQELQTLRGVFVRQPENALDIKDSSAGSQWETDNLLWELSVSNKRIWDLERERECQAKEIKRYKEHISEIILHSEAQSSVYQQKFQTLEAMVCDAKKCPLPTSEASSMTNKTDRSSTRQRGSGSPFRCISSLVQQMNSEKDHELSVAKNRIQELEALATDRQKQVCMLSARLAAVDNMTHDVIRDLLEVKLDMANYANLIDLKELHKLLENDWQQSRRSAKDEEISLLKAKVVALVEENNSLVEKTRAEILAKEEKLEKIHHRDQLLTAQNEMLKLDKLNLTRKITELDEMTKTFVGSQSIQELIKSPNAQEKDFLSQNKEFARRLAESDKLLQRAKTELASYSTRQ